VLVSIAKFAEMCGYTRAGIYRAVNSGHLIFNGRKIDTEAEANQDYLVKAIARRGMPIPAVLTETTSVKIKKAVVKKSKPPKEKKIKPPKPPKEKIEKSPTPTPTPTPPEPVEKPEPKKVNIRNSKILTATAAAGEDERLNATVDKLERKAQAELDKTLAQLARERVRLAQETAALIPKVVVTNALGRIGATILNYFLPLGKRLAPIIAAKLGVDDPVGEAFARRLIDEEVERCLEAMKLEIGREL
jgi:hypothetical protein